MERSANVGDRVMALTGTGAFPEETTSPRMPAACYKIPDQMDFISSRAAFPVTYGTSHGAFDWRAHLQPGEWLLVFRRGGRRGAHRSRDRRGHGTAGGDCLRQRPRKAGHRAAARRRPPDRLFARRHSRAVKAITGGRGADVIYHPVGGDAFDASLRSIASGRHVVIVGFASGRIARVPADVLLVKNIDVIGFYWGSCSGAEACVDARLVRQAAALVCRGQTQAACVATVRSPGRSPGHGDAAGKGSRPGKWCSRRGSGSGLFLGLRAFLPQFPDHPISPPPPPIRRLGF